MWWVLSAVCSANDRPEVSASSCAHRGCLATFAGVIDESGLSRFLGALVLQGHHFCHGGSPFWVENEGPECVGLEANSWVR